MLNILPKWARETVLEADGIDGKLTRVKCSVRVNSDDIAKLDTAIDEMVEFRESIKAKYNI